MRYSRRDKCQLIMHTTCQQLLVPYGRDVAQGYWDNLWIRLTLFISFFLTLINEKNKELIFFCILGGFIIFEGLPQGGTDGKIKKYILLLYWIYECEVADKYVNKALPHSCNLAICLCSSIELLSRDTVPRTNKEFSDGDIWTEKCRLN